MAWIFCGTIHTIGRQCLSVLLLLLILVKDPGVLGSSYEAAGNPRQLLDCINDNQEDHWVTSSRNALLRRPSSLRVIGAWWSRKPALVPLTITTQVSAQRVWQLKALCMTYPGPVSVALYVGLLHGKASRYQGLLRRLAAEAGRFFDAMEGQAKCKMDMMLVREMFDDPDARVWYPVNQLRNYARLQARTPLIGLIDGDLLVSPKLVTQLRNLTQQAFYMDMLHNKKTALVLPAFVTRQGSIHEQIALSEKAIVMRRWRVRMLYQQRLLSRFDPRSPGHEATNYTRWFNSTEPYEVTYAARYEPWVLVDRQLTPWHDVLFKGYGLNKIVHLEHMNATGYKYMVHPYAFLIHRAHEMTEAKRNVLKWQMHAKRLGKQRARAAAKANATANAASSPTELEEDAPDDDDVDDDEEQQDLRIEDPQQMDGQQQMDQQQGQQEDYRRQLARRLQQLQQAVDNMALPDGVSSQSKAAAAPEPATATGTNSSGAPPPKRVKWGKTSVYGYTRALGEEVRARMAAGTYEPRVDRALEACLAQLSWWNASAPADTSKMRYKALHSSVYGKSRRSKKSSRSSSGAAGSSNSTVEDAGSSSTEPEEDDNGEGAVQAGDDSSYLGSSEEQTGSSGEEQTASSSSGSQQVQAPRLLLASRKVALSRNALHPHLRSSSIHITHAPHATTGVMEG